MEKNKSFKYGSLISFHDERIVIHENYFFSSSRKFMSSKNNIAIFLNRKQKRNECWIKILLNADGFQSCVGWVCTNIQNSFFL